MSINIGLLCIIIVLTCQNNAISQNFLLGTPHIHNHSKEIYRAGSQNWAVKFDSSHIYFANNGGLLSYNGIKWQVIGTPNNTIMRSLAIAEDDKIYVGAQNEIGYFEPNENGELVYINLKDSLQPNIPNVSEVWNLEIINNDIFFTSENQVYKYSRGNIQSYGHGSYISKMSKIDDEIWYHSSQEGIFTIKNGQETLVSNSYSANGLKIINFIKGYNDQIFIITERQGIFTIDNDKIIRWETNADAYIKDKRISSAYFHSKFGLFIGTYLGGFVNINEDGLTSILMNKQNGLQNNAINCMSISPNGVLWLGTNNGIDEVDLSTAYRRFYPDNELEGAVYDMDIWKDHLFFSTSNGLYQISKESYYNPFNQRVFKLVPGSEGQTWGTDIINNQLFCAHHEGPMIITEELKAEKISDEISSWKFQKISSTHVALGTYKGISLYKILPTGRLQFDRKIDGFEESSRIMVFDKFKNLWISHPYKYVYRIKFNDDFTEEEVFTYSDKNGFKTNDRNYAFNVNDLCYLTNETGIYKYDEKQDSFTIDQTLNDLFRTDNHVRRLIQNNNQIYCITDQSTTKLTIQENGLDNEIQREDLSELSTTDTYIGGFEALYPLNDSSLIVFSEDGALEYIDFDKKEVDLDVNIKEITLPNQRDRIVYAGNGPISSLALAPNENAIRFSFGPKFSNSNAPYMYSTRLGGTEDEWSIWSANTVKEYTNLSFGNQLFEVKARNHIGQIGKIKSIPFTIDTPWYKGWKASLLYIFLFLGSLIALFLIPRKKYQENTAQLEGEKRETEEKMEQIRQEKLLNDINHKNKELASSTLLLLQKNQTLVTLRSKFDELNVQIKNPELQKELNKILSVFRSDLRLNDDWDKFSLHFDQVHQDFIKKLKSKHPTLSTNDHKLCAYLKMNLTTKEIAPLLGISIRGVEISRYRLRKKLELDRSENLNDYLNELA